MNEQSPRMYAERVLEQSQQTLQQAVAIAYPNNPELSPLEAFPKPSPVRGEATPTGLTSDQQTALAEQAKELGFGSPLDYFMSKEAVSRPTVIIEGGQPHKIVSEVGLIDDDTTINPRTIFMSGSPHRKITGAAERDMAERLLGMTGDFTEYDVTSSAARKLTGVRLLPPEVLPFGYDITDGYQLVEGPTGQFQALGEIKHSETEVLGMQISRRDLPDGKYELQPSGDRVIEIVDRLQRRRGDHISPIVLTTSGTYLPSRRVSVAIAGLTLGRKVTVAAYGNDRLNEVKGTDAPAPLDQLPSELYVLAEQTAKLEAALRRS